MCAATSRQRENLSIAYQKKIRLAGEPAILLFSIAKSNGNRCLDRFVVSVTG